MESKFVTVSCPTCKLQFAYTRVFYQKTMEEGTTVFCPSGDPLHFTLDKAKKETLIEENKRLTGTNLKLEIEIKKVKDYNNTLVSKLDQLEAKLEEKK